MAKDSYWFKHDSTAGRGLRMRKMAHIYGHWGKGIYWDVIEILRDQENYCFDYDTSSLQMLCDLIGCKEEAKFISWMRDCVQVGLFDQQQDKFFSPVLIENMHKWETLKQNGSKGGRPVNQDNNQTDNQSDNQIHNHNSIEEKKREENIIKEDSREFLVFPFLSSNFKDIWDVLLKEKKWRKKSFSALQASLNKLGKVSEGEAVEMITNAIAGEWQGIHELNGFKTKVNLNKNNSIASKDELLTSKL